jgi:hypothetical protein
MSSPNRTINLTVDNFCDYLSTDFAESLVANLDVGPAGLFPNDPIVTRFLTWMASENSRSSDVSYEMSRPEAATLLEILATRPDNFWD